MTLINLFNSIGNTSSKTEKENIISANSSNEEFKNVLKFVYNPFIVTGLAKKKIAKKVTPKENSMTTLAELMEYVQRNNTGSDEVIATVKYVLNQMNEPEAEFAVAVLTKDLKVGITSTTINKVLGKNFIPKYDVMLASKYEKHEAKVKGDFQVTLKLDGIRCTVFNDEKTGPKLFSRQGHPIEGLVEIEKSFNNLPQGYVYDGELIAVNTSNLSSDDLFRFTQKLVRTDGVKTGVQLWVFDMLPIEEFLEGKSKQKLKDRFNLLKNTISDLKTNSESDGKHIELVPVYYVGQDKNKIYEISNEVTAQGYEGLMVSPLSAHYETKRSTTLLKVKKFHTVDLKIVGYEEHKHGNKLGSLVVDYKGYFVNVGSGFSDLEREKYWDIKDELINQIVEVGYFEESTNEQGGLSLRFPTFKRMRPDKTEPSYN